MNIQAETNQDEDKGLVYNHDESRVKKRRRGMESLLFLTGMRDKTIKPQHCAN